MSTVAIARKGNAVAIAADTLTKDGYTKQPSDLMVNSSKIFRVGKTVIGYTGSISWQPVMKRYFSKLKEPPEFQSVDSIYETVLRMHHVLKKRYGLNTDDEDNDEFESSGFTLALINQHGGFIVYPDRSVSEIAKFYAIGAGYRLALGAMYALYESTPDAEAVARSGIEAAAEFDEDTGLPVESVRVQLEQV